MKRLKKVLLIGMAVSMLFTAVGCGEKESVISEGNGEIPKTLTIFGSMGDYAIKAGAKDNNDTLFFQMMEEKTGCHIEWNHPAAGAGEEKFNLMVASGKLPDLIIHNWSTLSDGAKKYADDGIIIPLRELIEKSMPNLAQYNKDNPHIAKQYVDDSGEIYYIPVIRHDPELKIFQGPQIRQDWLEKLGLNAPTTPEELYNVLKAFKTQDPNGNGKADEIPMSGVKFEKTSQAIGNLLWQFGVANGFYVKDGDVKYGILEPEFEEGLKYITKLYKEGLIDKDYLINDRDKMDNKVMNDKVGFVYSLQPGNYYRNMNDGTRKVVGIPHLRAEGVKDNVFDTSYVQDVVATSIAVTTANKNPSGTLRWLDEFFSEDGIQIMNYGKEGLTFEFDENKEPVFTDYILNNPDGKSSSEMCGMNIGTYATGFPTVQLWGYYKQILTPWGKESIETWGGSANAQGVVPSLSFTEEESKTIANVMSQIETFVSEKVNKIVIGNASIDELSAIRSRVEKMGIDEIIKIYNNALKRYNDR